MFHNFGHSHRGLCHMHCTNGQGEVFPIEPINEINLVSLANPNILSIYLDMDSDVQFKI